VNVALPHVQRTLGFSGNGLEWVVNAYALSFGGLMLLGGRDGDLLGRVPADRRPGRPGPGEGLGHQVLRRVPVTDTHQDGEQALILDFAVEVGEVRSLGSHTLSTRNRCPPVT
jgi:hypothetical protein